MKKNAHILSQVLLFGGTNKVPSELNGWESGIIQDSVDRRNVLDICWSTASTKAEKLQNSEKIRAMDMCKFWRGKINLYIKINR